MSSSPALPDPADRASQRDEDAQYYRQVLHELVESRSRLARAIDRQATPEPAPAAAPELSIAFERVARTLRRTIALACKITDPAQPSRARRSRRPAGSPHRRAQADHPRPRGHHPPRGARPRSRDRGAARRALRAAGHARPRRRPRPAADP